MDFEYLKRLLAHQAEAIRSIVSGVSPEQARWKPAPEAWSILEVINHLYDEEREDFRQRLDFILHRPTEAWPPNDPMVWVTERQYNERDLAESVQNFMDERQVSLVWLESLSAPDWEASVKKKWGVMRAGDMLASWAVHDQWHLQQLIQLRRAYTVEQVAPYSVMYAGTL